MVAWIGLVVLAGVLVAALVAGGLRRGAGGTARATLDQRLAGGELGVEEHARRVAVLDEEASRGSRWSRAVVVGIAVLVVAGLVGMVAWGMGGWSVGSWGHSGWSMGGHMGRSGSLGTADEPVPGAPEFTVTATDLAFAPSTIEVEAGPAVNLTLVNDGAVFHDLSIPDLDFVLGAEPGQAVSGSLVVDQPGTHEFVCGVPGHADAGMRGTLEVVESP